MRIIDTKNERKRATRLVTYYTILKHLYFAKMVQTLFPKNKIQKMSPTFAHFMYLIFERILLCGVMFLLGDLTQFDLH